MNSGSGSCNDSGSDSCSGVSGYLSLAVNGELWAVRHLDRPEWRALGSELSANNKYSRTRQGSPLYGRLNSAKSAPLLNSSICQPSTFHLQQP